MCYNIPLFKDLKITVPMITPIWLNVICEPAGVCGCVLEEHGWTSIDSIIKVLF